MNKRRQRSMTAPSILAQSITGELVGPPGKNGRLSEEGIRLAHIVDMYLSPTRLLLTGLSTAVSDKWGIAGHDTAEIIRRIQPGA